MRKNTNQLLLLSFVTLLLGMMTGCHSSDDEALISETTGYRPIYSNDPTLKQIVGGPARVTVNAGKMFTVGNLLFQVEIDSGIHVIDYSNRTSPRKLGFIRSFLCKELAVKNGRIYTNNFSDLVVIDYTNINAVQETGRVAGVFPDLALQSPPQSTNGARVYFECPDPSKGNIAGWTETTITKPKCWK